MGSARRLRWAEKDERFVVANWVIAVITHQKSQAGWWCNFTILKNDGVKVNGFRMTSFFYEMENKIPWFETTNQQV